MTVSLARLADTWGVYLDQPEWLWKLYITMTFRDPVKSEDYEKHRGFRLPPEPGKHPAYVYSLHEAHKQKVKYMYPKPKIIHPEAAHKLTMLMIHKLNRQIYGQNYWKHKDTKGVYYAIGWEYQSRGAIHNHMIVGDVPDDVDRYRLHEDIYKLAGRNHVDAYDPALGARFYLSKAAYAWKRGEIELGGPLLHKLEGIPPSLDFGESVQ